MGSLSPNLVLLSLATFLPSPPPWLPVYPFLGYFTMGLTAMSHLVKPACLPGLSLARASSISLVLLSRTREEQICQIPSLANPNSGFRSNKDILAAYLEGN